MAQLRSILYLTLILLLGACRQRFDDATTPTVAVVITQEGTNIVVQKTALPSPTLTASLAPTRTSTASPTASLTSTSRPTQTFTLTPSATSTLTTTPRPSLTFTPRPTQTLTLTPSITPSSTLTTTSTWTASPSLTSTPRPSQTLTSTPKPSLTPTFTKTASPTQTLTSTFTWTASVTPSLTLTPRLRPSNSPTSPPIRATNTVSLPPSPTAILNLRPTGTPQIQASALPTEVSTSGDGVGIGTNIAPFSTITPLPTLLPLLTNTPAIEIALAEQSGVAILPPEQSSITLADARQVTVIRPAAGSPNGAFASFEADNQLYVNGKPLTISPASIYGLPAHMKILDLEWTTDGRYLAFVVEGNPQQSDQTGVWVLDTFNQTSQQIMRNDDRHATEIDWSPNGTVVLIHLKTPAGKAFTFLPRDYPVNNGFRMHPYADATWALDSASVLVSGTQLGEGDILGRVLLDYEQSYVDYNVLSAGILHTAAATELPEGEIAFLGSTTLNPNWRLYSLSPTGVLTPLTEILSGQLLGWEWHPNRTALLVLLENELGERRLWIVHADGRLTDITPANTVPSSAYWE